MVIIVLISSQKYIFDIGFGAEGFTFPLPLVYNRAQQNIAPSRIRLVRDWIPEQEAKREEHKVWMYQYQRSEHDRWETQYCFIDQEFLPQDFEIMNYWTSVGRTSWFTQVVIVVKFLMDEDGKEVVGQLILNGNVVKRRIKGETEVLKECKSEQERVKALEEVFGIRLEKEEREGIKGLVTELKG